MGYMRHHAIVLTGGDWGDSPIQSIHARAVEIFGADAVSLLGPKTTNMCQSFCVFPDGSKEGWNTSNGGDENRVRFKTWLRSCRDDCGPCDWVEVQYGDDNRHTTVIDHSDLI